MPLSKSKMLVFKQLFINFKACCSIESVNGTLDEGKLLLQQWIKNSHGQTLADKTKPRPNFQL